MKLKKYLIILLIITISIIIFIYKILNNLQLSEVSIGGITNNYKSNTTTYAQLTEMQKAIQEVAYSYYTRGINIQYNSEKVTYFSPEEATSQNTNYMVCSGFTRNIYNELLGIKIPNSTTNLLDYSKNFVGNPEVIGYGTMKNDNFIMKMYDSTAENNYTELTNPSLTDIIPYVRIGDILTFTGHTFMIYDVIYDENGNVTDAWIMESGHGKGKSYVMTKIPTGTTIKNNVTFGNSNHYLYHNSYQNTEWDDGLVQGSLNVTKLSSYTQWININTNSRKNEYSILRFITMVDNEKAILNYQGANYNDSNHSGETIELSDKIKDRLKFSRIYIEKTVDAHADDIVEANDELTYTICVKNNSYKNYNENLIVSENISKYVTYKTYTSSKENITFDEDLNNNKISWNVGNLSSGEEIKINYTVKVKKNNTGKVIESTGTVGNIPSSIVKNTIGINLEEKQANDIKEKYEALKEIYSGKKLINEIYKQAFEIDLGLENFEITNLINDTNSQSQGSSTISLNKNNNLYGTVLNKYWSKMACNDYSSNGGPSKVYDLKNWKSYTNSTRRQDTIYSENFKTGDILIYTNYNDKKYTYKNGILTQTTQVTYENGEYAYIYIDGKGFVGVNLGDDGIAETQDDRNEFNAKYYSDNGLYVYSDTSETDENILEFANYQSLFGKDCYVILRPSLAIDLVKMKLDVNYSITRPTNKSVTVTITSNEKMLEVNGWDISDDELTLTKTYSENTTEEVEIYDYQGNKTIKTIEINNIDKVNPTAQISYSTVALTSESVTVTIISNEKIQQIEGWTIDNTQTILTKIFTINSEETVTITDLAGNTNNIYVKIANIDKTEIEADVKYSTTILTNKDVIVTITLNKVVKELENWKLSEDRKILTRVFTLNDEEEIEIYDLAGHTKKIKIRVANIDKEKPKVNVSYSTTKTTNEDVIATITSNKEILEPDGWTLSNDQMSITKLYSKNITETITVTDLFGNSSDIKISILNINKNSDNFANNFSNNQDGDTTTAKMLLPQAGKKNIIVYSLAIIILIGLIVFLYAKIEKYKDIK